MVMGRDSRSNGRGFESRHSILDGHFSHLFVVKIFNVCLQRPKINKKRPGLSHFYNVVIVLLLPRRPQLRTRGEKASSVHDPFL